MSDGLDWLSYTAVTPRASLKSDANKLTEVVFPPARYFVLFAPGGLAFFHRPLSVSAKQACKRGESKIGILKFSSGMWQRKVLNFLSFFHVDIMEKSSAPNVFNQFEN